MIVKDKGYSFGKRRGFMQNEIILLFRMLLAVLCGALIGLERSRRQKEAGIRTHIMVTLGSALIVGLIIAIFQATTSIQEQTLTFLPKFLVILLILAIVGGAMFGNLSEYTVRLFSRIPDLAN